MWPSRVLPVVGGSWLVLQLPRLQAATTLQSGFTTIKADMEILRSGDCSYGVGLRLHVCFGIGDVAEGL